MNYSIPFVCAFGILTVFFSLVIIVFLSSIMSTIIRKTEKTNATPVPAAVPAAAPAPSAAPVAPSLDPELVAAITAAIAEDLKTDFSNVRITAIQQM